MMWGRIAVGIAAASMAVILFGSTGHALDIPPAPTLDSPIVDQTSTLTAGQVAQLAEQIRTGRGQKSYQIGILMVPSLDGAVLEEYALSVARAWGIGDQTNNGVLLLVAKDDRLVRIEVGRGLEGDLTDTRAKKIITTVIAPKFRSGDYYGGISAAVSSIQLAVTTQADPALERGAPRAATIIFENLWLIMGAITLVLMWLAAILGRSKSWWAGGVIGAVIGGLVVLLASAHALSVVALIVLVPLGLLFDFVVSRNYREHTRAGTMPSWWAGGGTFGDDDGGIGGGGTFGGGGFSGGGASGSW